MLQRMLTLLSRLILSFGRRSTSLGRLYLVCGTPSTRSRGRGFARNRRISGGRNARGTPKSQGLVSLGALLSTNQYTLLLCCIATLLLTIRKHASICDGNKGSAPAACGHIPIHCGSTRTLHESTRYIMIVEWMGEEIMNELVLPTLRSKGIDSSIGQGIGSSLPVPEYKSRSQNGPHLRLI
jgi:hypothetical protein